ncbi:MAG: SWIM zinc finger family protein [Chloroflexi bacterium]|nr:SWIM zinc finger family protein [Chloroflexota bacterium]
MRSSLIGKIEKARRYAQEPERVSLLQFTALFHGEHADYTVSCNQGSWSCSCPFFRGHERCSHTMALQEMLGELIPAAAQLSNL